MQMISKEDRIVGTKKVIKVIYFDDINLNVEDYDPDFAEAIAYQFGRVDAHFNKKTDLSKEEIIKLGKKSSFYKPYLKNIITIISICVIS